ncbi:MAG: TIM44-like domain-containing protein [Nitrospirales bacterium]|nr:TIM44-like domain-containing protein [Nitrospirales bacterium]
MKTTRLIATIIVLSLIGAPAVSFAKARGGSGGYSSGSRSNGTSGSMGSRGSRTYDQNGSRPIERSTTPSAAPSQPASAPSAAAPAVQPAPAMQPSFLQRHPLLAGIAGGMAGSWIGHMLFGATDSSARVSEEPRDGESAPSGFGSPGLLVLLMLLGAGAVYYFMRTRRTPAPDFSGLTRNALRDTSVEHASTGGIQSKALEREVTPGDEAAFRQILIDVQTAWGKGDLAGLRRLVTPEMVFYFSTGLSENTSQEVENRVEDISIVKAEVQETWTEDATQYATLLLRWTARDYTVSLAKRPGEPGYVVEGNEHTPCEAVETWTFMRYQNGKWLLSAIQQQA